MKRIIVVGGGSGGVSAANRISQSLSREISTGAVELMLIDGKKNHFYQPGFLEVPFDILEKEETHRPMEYMLSKRIKRVERNAKRIDLKERKVYLENESITYDFIIIATGASYSYEEIPGLRENTEDTYSLERSLSLKDKIENFRGGKIAVGVSSLPYKCMPAPLETVFLLDDYLKKQGLRDKTSITYFFPLPIPFPGKPVVPKLEKMLKDRNIETELSFVLKSVDGANKELISKDGGRIPYDLAIVVPPHKGTQLIFDSGIGDERGWIPVNKFTLEIENAQNAYAIGDATNLQVSKAGSVADAEAITVSARIVSQIKGEKASATYDGTGGAIFLTGLNRAGMLSSNYNRPPTFYKDSNWFYMLKLIYNKVYWTMTEKAVLSEVKQ
ncbi:NAD(P)/FAD-dependent oxidoreductase [Cuniculiplasma sp. SKW3]|uniref:NAD(P)/FAD-dependent oxidoreductase n=1 Tax=Cuniculiplasma sp. SKW3 TaxID=3400170 RepID=UPI003FD1DB63